MKRLLATLLFVPQLAWAAHDFDTGEYAESSTVEFTDHPATICCLVKPDDITAFRTVMSLSRSTGTTQRFALVAHGNTAGDPIWAQTTDDSGSLLGVSAGSYTTDWQSACAVFTSTTSASAVLEGTATSGSGTAVDPTGMDRTNIGAVWASAARSAASDFVAAECGIWNVALAPGDYGALADRFAPPCVKRASLLAYYPMVRDTTTLADLFSATANNLTLGGTTAVADHPRVINCQ